MIAHWAMLCLETNVKSAASRKALQRVKELTPRLIERLREIPPYTDGYDPNHRSGLRNLTETFVLAALKQPTLVSEADMVERILDQGRVGTIAKRMQAPGGSLGEVQEFLCADATGILHFQPGYRNHYWVLIDRQSVSIYPIAPPHEYRRLQEALYKSTLLAQTLDFRRGFEQDLSTFSDLVLPAAMLAEIREREWEQICTSGIAGHYYVPLDLLQTPQGESLGDLYPITHLPSITVGLAMARRQLGESISTPAAVFAFAAPEIQPGLHTRGELLGPGIRPSLPFTDDHARALYGQLNATWDIATLHGPEQATVEALTQALSGPRLAMLHIVSHGDRAKDLLRTPGILLHSEAGTPALVTHKDLEGLSAPWISILTACETTGVEPRTGDDGGHHLAGSLIALGGNAVLCSALPLEYQESLTMDAALFHRLSQGHTAMRALFLARQDMRGKVSDLGRFAIHAFGLSNLGIGPSVERYDGFQVERAQAPGGADPMLGSATLWRWALGLVLGLVALLLAALALRKRAAAH